MTKELAKNIEQEALDRYGIEAQEMMLFEECGELINALAKLHRKRANHLDLITELADVSIMIDQMALYYGEDLFEKERERKLLRLNDRMKMNDKH